jgi:hypothetical protein
LKRVEYLHLVVLRLGHPAETQRVIEMLAAGQSGVPKGD